jgi:hypothetical protein
MASRARREAVVLLVALLFAVACPIAAARHADRVTQRRLVPRLCAALGESVEIGGVEASLTGSVRIERVAVGAVFTAAAIEASVGLESLLSGQLGADEIRIESPHIRTRSDADGDTRLHAILARAQRAYRPGARSAGPGARRLRRIVVSGGELRIDLAGRGVLRARGVELHPQRGGVRVVAGDVAFELAHPPLSLAARFDRAAGDLALPELALGRALAVGGVVRISSDGAAPVTFDHVTLAHNVDAAPGTKVEALVRDTRPGRIALSITQADDGATAVTVTGEAVPLAPLAALAPGFAGLGQARADGRASVRLGAAVAVDFDVHVDGAVLDHPRIASEPVPIDARLRAAVQARRRGGVTELLVPMLDLEMAGVSVRARGEAVLGPGEAIPRRLRIHAALPRTSCMRVLNAIPAAARRRLAGLDVEGTLAAHAALHLDAAQPAATALAIDVDMKRCQALREAIAADPRALKEPFAHEFPDGTIAVIERASERYVSLPRIPPILLHAFVAAEDARFFSHRGFDLHQIEQSLAADLAERRWLRGGSTISQQLVKNVFLDPERTFGRKLEEAVLTWRVESVLGKREILEAYLNILELGEGIYGIGPAARIWFDKELRQLSLREVAFLAAMTPAPRTYSRRILATGAIDSEIAHRVDVVLGAMREARVISLSAYRAARRAPLRVRVPRLARAE